MKKIFVFCLSLALVAGLVGCSEDALSPSDPQEFVEFPQGNNPYDTEFKAFYEDYATYVLYKFSEVDFRWNVTTMLPYYYEPADESAIGGVWDFFQEKCLTAWPNEFLRRYLPTKILLAGEIYDKKTNWVWDPDTQTSTQQEVKDKHYDAIYGFNHLALGVVNANFATMSEEAKLKAVGQFSCALIGYATSRGMMEIPQEFKDIYTKGTQTGSNSDYSGQWGYSGRGHLEYNAAIDVYYDFGLYVKYLTTMSKEAYEAWAYDPNFDAGSSWDNSIGEWGGYVYHYYIKQKTAVVLEYFQKEFGIDLHEMGNRAAGVNP